MTREEAKEILTHNWTRVDNPNYSESELDEAFFMAIEALHNSIQMSNIQELQAENGFLKEMVKFYREQQTVEVVRCKDCRWYRDTFLDTKITPTCDRHIDDRYGTLVGGITEDSFCSYGERREP